MQSTEIVDIELTSPGGPPPVVHAVAGDIYSRFVEMHLFAAGVPFEPPDGTTCIIGWRRTDTDYGAYNSIMEDDGKTSHEAYSFDGSVLTIELDWHVCQKAGNVAVNVSMNGEGGSRLHTWELCCRVARGAVADAEDPTKPSESATDAANRAEKAAKDAEKAAKDAEAALGQVDDKIDAAVQGVTDEAQQAAKDAAASAGQAAASAGKVDEALKEDGPVAAVNGKTGRVTLTAADVKALGLPAAPKAGQLLVIDAVGEDGSITVGTADQLPSLGFVEMLESIPASQRLPNTLYSLTEADYGSADA